MYFDMIETFKPTEGFELTRWDFVLEKVIWHDRNLAPPEGFELTRWDSKDPRSSPTILINFTKEIPLFFLLGIPLKIEFYREFPLKLKNDEKSPKIELSGVFWHI